MLTRCPTHPTGRHRQLDRASDHGRLRLDHRGSHEHAPTVQRNKVVQEPEDPFGDPNPDCGVNPGLGDRSVVPGPGEDERGADDMKGEEDLVRSPAQPLESKDAVDEKKDESLTRRATSVSAVVAGLPVASSTEREALLPRCPT